MLYKLAKEKKKKTTKKRNDVNSIKALGATLGATAVGRTATGLAVRGLFDSAPTQDLSTEEIKKLYEAVGGKKNVKVYNTIFGMGFESKPKSESSTKNSAANASNASKEGNELRILKEVTMEGNAGYAPKHATGRPHDIIVVPRETNHATVAHEMGHSVSRLSNSKLGHKAYVVSKGVTKFVPFIAAKRLNDAYNRGASKEEIEKIKTQDDIAAFGAAAPYLGEETFANLKALQALKRTGNLSWRGALPLVASELSYLSGPLMTPLAHKTVDWLHRNDR